MLLDDVQKIAIRDYTYDLPDTRIAKYPVEPRDASKLLYFDGSAISEYRFRDVSDLLEPNSLLVYNNTKVIHARLLFQKESGAKIELFCLEPAFPADHARNLQAIQTCEWYCLVGNAKKWKTGKLKQILAVHGRQVLFEAERTESKERLQRIRFTWSTPATEPALSFGELLECAGQIPIPPYLNRASEKSDESCYQTVYSKIEGSVAAPTAGLHFTPEVLRMVDQKHILRREVTLHVSASTFQPVKSEQIGEHPMHTEFISIEKSLLRELQTHLGHITAVGTTSVRTLESLYWFGTAMLNACYSEHFVLNQWFPYTEDRHYTAFQALQAIIDYLEQHSLECFTADTRLLIAPGYRFRLIDAMLTNFHQPQSTLLLLVSAFTGNSWRDIYRYALEHEFRFLSYGDSSLLKKKQDGGL